MIFDTHAHYDDELYNEDRETLLASLPENNIVKVMNVGASKKMTEDSIALAEKYDFIYAAVGIHPSEILEYESGKADMDWLRKMAEYKKSMAIGEIGLDYHYPEPEPELQRKWFREQLALAKELDMPIIIHSRDAAKETYDILKEMGGEKLKAVIHCFSYEPEMAREFLKLGYYIGIGGVLTYKNARKQKEVLAEMPLDKLLLETDCPYLTPSPHRGERNSSLFLPFVVKEMADIRGMTESEIEDTTYKNALEFYEIKE